MGNIAQGRNYGNINIGVCEMIGQHDLLQEWHDLVAINKFPRFSILVGPAGSGKKTICNLLAKQMGLVLNVYGTGVEDVRNMIQSARTVATPILYVIPDADKMSLSAKNALLKLTEEPPRAAYVIITVTNLSSLLGTIRSRGTVFYMSPYSAEDISEYCVGKYSPEDKVLRIICSVCETPGEVDMMMSSNPEKFYSDVEKVVDHIATVSGANAFKMAQMLHLKESDTGKYDVGLFLKIFTTICSSRVARSPVKYIAGVRCASKYLQELRITGINKASTIDMFILDIRKAWMEA